MIQAFGRLLLITFSVLICLILAVFGLRTLGQSQVYGEYSHPLLTGQPWVIAMGGDSSSGAPLSLPALQAAQKISPEMILGLRIRKTSDNHWVAYFSDKLEDHTDGQGYAQRMTLADLKKLHYKGTPDFGPMSLEDVLSQFPKSSFYIEVLHPGVSDQDSLFKIIKSSNVEERIILTSPFINTTKVLRTAGYKWLTGASTAEASKARVMSSLYLETVADIPSDVLIIEKAAASSRLISELQRRLKVALFVADDPKDLPDQALAIGRSGVLTTRPTLFKSSYAK